MFRPETANPARRVDQCVEQARRAREAGGRFFQIYLPIGELPLERWLAADEQTRLVRALEAEGWSLDDVGSVSEASHDGYVGAVTMAEKTIAAIYTFRRAEA